MISKQITYIFLQIAVLFDFKNAECDASPPVAFYAGKKSVACPRLNSVEIYKIAF